MISSFRKTWALALAGGLSVCLAAGTSTAARAEKRPPKEKPAHAAKKLVPGAGLHLTRYGKGPAVVFLHGLGGDSSVFIDEMQKLEATHTVVLVDMPGHGQSKAPPPHVELPAIARQIAEALEAHKIGPAVIIGHSLGGMLAGYLALEAPQAVRGLIVVDSMFAPYPIPQEELEKLRFQLGRDRTRALRGFLGPMTKDERQLDKIVAGAWHVKPQTFIGYLDFACERDDLRRRAGEIRVPVHVLASPLLTDGQSEPARVQLALGQVGYGGVARLSYDYFPTSKHWLFWDDPHGFHNSIQNFLRRVEGDLPVATIPQPVPVKLKFKKRHSLAKAPRIKS